MIINKLKIMKKILSFTITISFFVLGYLVGDMFVGDMYQPFILGEFLKCFLGVLMLAMVSALGALIYSITSYYVGRIFNP
jgi:hypothetical protein